MLSKISGITATTKIARIYRASIDGWNVADFHKFCDSRGKTITFIKSTKGFVSGGFTSLSWTSSGDYKNDS